MPRTPGTPRGWRGKDQSAKPHVSQEEMFPWPSAAPGRCRGRRTVPGSMLWMLDRLILWLREWPRWHKEPTTHDLPGDCCWAEDARQRAARAGEGAKAVGRGGACLGGEVRHSAETKALKRQPQTQTPHGSGAALRSRGSRSNRPGATFPLTQAAGVASRTEHCTLGHRPRAHVRKTTGHSGKGPLRLPRGCQLCRDSGAPASALKVQQPRLHPCMGP